MLIAANKIRLQDQADQHQRRPDRGSLRDRTSARASVELTRHFKLRASASTRSPGSSAPVKACDDPHAGEKLAAPVPWATGAPPPQSRRPRPEQVLAATRCSQENMEAGCQQCHARIAAGFRAAATRQRPVQERGCAAAIETRASNGADARQRATADSNSSKSNC